MLLLGNRVGDPAAARAFARPYRDVVNRLNRWTRTGQVLREDTPALYLHEYTAGGLTIRGLVGGLDLSRRARDTQERAVLPHEGVHPGQVRQLARRMGQMRLNPAPILLVHRGTAAVRGLLDQVIRREPLTEYVDRSGQTQRIWAIRDPDELALVATELSETHAVIADGHHRYAAYLRLQSDNPGTDWDQGLAMLVDQDDTPLFLGAIHRLLGGVRLTDLDRAAEGLPDVSVEALTDDALAALAPETVVATDGEGWRALSVRPTPDRAVVEIIHETLLPGSPDPRSRSSITIRWITPSPPSTASRRRWPC